MWLLWMIVDEFLFEKITIDVGYAGCFLNSFSLIASHVETEFWRLAYELIIIKLSIKKEKKSIKIWTRKYSIISIISAKTKNKTKNEEKEMKSNKFKLV